jgi:hypothetical protein
MLNAGGVGGADGTLTLAAPVLIPLGGLGSFVDVIVLTFAKPAAIIPAAPIKPNIPPCERALFAPA